MVFWTVLAIATCVVAVWLVAYLALAKKTKPRPVLGQRQERTPVRRDGFNEVRINTFANFEEVQRLHEESMRETAEVLRQLQASIDSLPTVPRVTITQAAPPVRPVIPRVTITQAVQASAPTVEAEKKPEPLPRYDREEPV